MQNFKLSTQPLQNLTCLLFHHILPQCRTFKFPTMYNNNNGRYPTDKSIENLQAKLYKLLL